MRSLSLGQEDPPEGMATDSSTLAWRIPWTEEPGRPQSTGLQRVRHDWSDSTQVLYMCLFHFLSISQVIFKTILQMRNLRFREVKLKVTE